MLPRLLPLEAELTREGGELPKFSHVERYPAAACELIELFRLEMSFESPLPELELSLPDHVESLGIRRGRLLSLRNLGARAIHWRIATKATRIAIPET